MTDRGNQVMEQGWKVFVSFMDRVEKEMGEENTRRLVELVEQFMNIMQQVRGEFEMESDNGGNK